MFSLICAWTNGWTNHRDACDIRRHRAHYDVTNVIRAGYHCVQVLSPVISLSCPRSNLTVASHSISTRGPFGTKTSAFPEIKYKPYCLVAVQLWQSSIGYIVTCSASIHCLIQWYPLVFEKPFFPLLCVYQKGSACTNWFKDQLRKIRLSTNLSLLLRNIFKCRKDRGQSLPSDIPFS